jgi:hypothetical protein
MDSLQTPVVEVVTRFKKLKLTPQPGFVPAPIHAFSSGRQITAALHPK